MKKSRRKPKETTTRTSGAETVDAPAGWSVVDGRLMQEYSFEDFLGAKAFIDLVSEACERHQHHAELHFGWGYAVVEIYTHDTNSITQADVDLANAINNLEG